MAEVEYEFFTHQMKMLENNALNKEHAAKETMWKNAGKTEGLQIWRIQSLRVTSWPKIHYGKFYDGDSYIILMTSDSPCGLIYDLHTWIGKYSTEDEYVMAAHKMMELFTYLDDKPVQHREIQEKESKLFKSYFDEVEYMHGGAKSVLKGKEHEENRPRLYHVHGQRMKAVINEIPLGVGEIDDTDVYILDSGSTIYQWNGRGCNNAEKSQAMQFRMKLKEERSGQSVKIEVIDQKEYGVHIDEFFRLLEEYSGTHGKHFKVTEEPKPPLENSGKGHRFHKKDEIPPVKRCDVMLKSQAPVERRSFKKNLVENKSAYSITELSVEQPEVKEVNIHHEIPDAESPEQILEVTKKEICRRLPSETQQQPHGTEEGFVVLADAKLMYKPQLKLELEDDIPQTLPESHLPRRQVATRKFSSNIPEETQLPRRQTNVRSEDKEARSAVKENSEHTTEVIEENESHHSPKLELSEKTSKVGNEEDCKCSSDFIYVKELYRLSDAEGEMKFTKIKEGNISMSDFDGMDVFIFDTKQTLFVWIGNGTTSAERKNAMTFAHNYLLQTDHPSISVTCLKEGMESEDFRSALM